MAAGLDALSLHWTTMASSSIQEHLIIVIDITSHTCAVPSEEQDKMAESSLHHDSAYTQPQ
jgi:hypothetical protein